MLLSGLPKVMDTNGISLSDLHSSHISSPHHVFKLVMAVATAVKIPYVLFSPSSDECIDFRASTSQSWLDVVYLMAVRVAETHR